MAALMESDEFELFNQYAIDESLNPFERLIRYQNSDFALQRLILARDLADTAEFTGPSGISSSAMTNALRGLANDEEPIIRQVLAQQLPSIVDTLLENNGVSVTFTKSRKVSLSTTLAVSTDDDEETDFSLQEATSDEEIPSHQNPFYRHLLEILLPMTAGLLVDTNSETGNSALVAFCAIAVHLYPEDKEAHLVQTILTLVDPERPNDYRQVGARLACLLAPVLGPRVATHELLPVVEQLSRDTVFETRSALISCLHYLTPFLPITSDKGENILERRFLPLVASLCCDKMWNVRKSAAEAIVPISISLPLAHRPTLIRFMRDLVSDQVRWVSVSAYEWLGQFIYTLPGEIPPILLKLFTDMAFGKSQKRDTRTAMIKYTTPSLTQHSTSLSSSSSSLQINANDADFAEFCAFAFPAVTLRLSTPSWPNALAPAHAALVHNVQTRVRSCIAASLHELAGILGTSLTERDLIPHFHRLLEDTDEVRIRLLSHASAFLSCISPSVRGDLVPLLCHIPETAQSWRVRLAVAKLLGQLVSLVPPSRLIPDVCDLTRRLLDDSVACVYNAALRSLVQTISSLQSLLVTQCTEQGTTTMPTPPPPPPPSLLLPPPPPPTTTTPPPSLLPPPPPPTTTTPPPTTIHHHHHHHLNGCNKPPCHPCDPPLPFATSLPPSFSPILTPQHLSSHCTAKDIEAARTIVEDATNLLHSFAQSTHSIYRQKYLTALQFAAEELNSNSSFCHNAWMDELFLQQHLSKLIKDPIVNVRLHLSQVLKTLPISYQKQSFIKKALRKLEQS